jgi:hypothetical protein
VITTKASSTTRIARTGSSTRATTGCSRSAREIYPRTRTSNAVAVNARYYLPYRAAIHGGYRFFTDTWGIGANTFELGYTHPWRQWTFELGYRYYSQGNADFYSDLFDRPEPAETSWRATRSCRRSRARR